jgi:hypothetical protein
MFNSEVEYDRAMDRIRTIDAILALDKRLTREYLSRLSLDALRDLEESLIFIQYET